MTPGETKCNEFSKGSIVTNSGIRVGPISHPLPLFLSFKFTSEARTVIFRPEVRYPSIAVPTNPVGQSNGKHINLYTDNFSPGSDNADFALGPGSCEGPGFMY